MNRLLFVMRAKDFATLFFLSALLCACGGDKPDTMLASAREYLAKNDPKAAVIQLKNVLQKNSELPEARYLLGSALLRVGDSVGSETELRKALALKHPPELVLPMLAEALIAQRQFKKLTDEFSQTELGKAEAQASFKTSLAVALAAQGKVELSKVAVSVALSAEPRYAPALLIQARDKAAKRDFDGALASVESIIAVAPANNEAWKLKGDILLYGKDNLVDALAAYRESVEAKSDFAAGHSAILNTLISQGNLDGAAKQLEMLKKATPNSVQVKYFDTLLAYQRKDYKRARELAQQLMKVAPEGTQSLQLAGAIELQAKSLLQAEAYLNKAVKAEPEALLARRLLTTTYLQWGQPAKALAILQPALKDGDADAQTNLMAGEVYLQNGDLAKAEEFFTKAAKQDPKDTRAKTALALSHLANGKDGTAIIELQEIAGSDSGIVADMALISAQMQRREFDRALKAIDALEKKQPNQPLASNLRGRALLAKKDVAGARKSFERSIAIDASFFPAVASLAALDLADKR